MAKTQKIELPGDGEVVKLTLHDSREATGRREILIDAKLFRSITIPLDDGELFVEKPRKLWWLGGRRSAKVVVFSGMRHMAHFAPSSGNALEVASILSGWEPKDEREVFDAGR